MREGGRAVAPPQVSVEVYALRVPEHAAAALARRAILSADERLREARLRRDDDRARFRVARVALRSILARRLGVAPETLRFAVDGFGKPALAGREAPSFNLSHSGDWVLIALAGGTPVGVDVERHPAAPVDLADYTRALGGAELDALAACAPAVLPAALARNWARKEAYLKAVGEGVARDPRLVHVGARADDRPVVVRDTHRSTAPGPWRLRDLALDGRHAACVVWRGAARQVLLRFALDLAGNETAPLCGAGLAGA